MSRRNPEYGHGPPSHKAKASYEFYQDLDSGKWWISDPKWGDLVLGEQFRDLEESVEEAKRASEQASLLAGEALQLAEQSV